MRTREFECKRCGAKITAHGGYDAECSKCGQTYNAFGQRIDYPYGQGEDYAGERWEDD